ncbi:MAG: hypothetical protein KatS3mg053_2906 [Candidatus Roseilinea sp.]|nr:MAG: hypothetical protein KatS3mg053_2906 [Candidatus Roseilinea sp.]
MREFEPAKVAYAETYAWVAYYQRDWTTLARLLVSLARDKFGLTEPQAAQASSLATQAQVAFAPFPDNDVPGATRLQQDFYRYIKDVHPQEPFDPIKAGELDVRWWVIHRQLFAERENQPLVEAIADLYVAVYRVPRERVLSAAFHRAEAMQFSDHWVREGHAPDSPLIPHIEAELLKSYQALREGIEL